MATGKPPPEIEIEDLVQTVYMKLIRNEFKLLKSYDPERAALSTWLSLVARSTTIDALRRKRQPFSLLEDTVEANPQEEASDPLPMIPLQLLTGRQKLVLSLLFEDEKSIPEAAELLGVTEQTVRSTKHKALERLRKHFSAETKSDEETNSSG